MNYEYDFETVELNEDQQKALAMGFDASVFNDKIKDVLNERAKRGWEPIAPFFLPTLWFRRSDTVDQGAQADV